jgi:hypothetical protein
MELGEMQGNNEDFLLFIVRKKIIYEKLLEMKIYIFFRINSSETTCNFKSFDTSEESGKSSRKHNFT